MQKRRYLHGAALPDNIQFESAFYLERVLMAEVLAGAPPAEFQL